MRNSYPTITLVVDLLKEQNYHLLTKSTKENFASEVRCFCVEAYNVYGINGDRRGWQNCLEEQKWFFDDLVEIAVWAPGILKVDRLGWFLSELYMSEYSFPDMMLVVVASGLDYSLLRGNIDNHVSEKSVRQWIMSRWSDCITYRHLILRSLEREGVEDDDLRMLCERRSNVRLWILLAFVAGVGIATVIGPLV